MVTSTSMSDSVMYERRYETRVRKFLWPEVQLHVWMLVMLGSACVWVGIFSSFVQVQQRLLLHVPWYFGYLITVGALGIVYVIVVRFLIFQNRLLPSIVLIGAFMMFVLWMVGLVVLSIELWGPSGSVSDNCNLAVFKYNPTGQSLNTLAWLEQRSICQAWQAGFAFGLVGAIFLLWIMAMAYHVFSG